jgi:hypothetical protein
MENLEYIQILAMLQEGCDYRQIKKSLDSLEEKRVTEPTYLTGDIKKDEYKLYGQIILLIFQIEIDDK